MRRALPVIAFAWLLLGSGAVVPRPGVGVGVTSGGARMYSDGPSFDLTFDRGSIAALSSTLTINGTTVAPSLRYIGEDAVTTTWTADGYGDTLTLQAGTAPTLDSGVPTAATADRSVDFNGGGYYKGPNNTTGDVTTEDMVVEAVVQIANTGTDYFVSKWTSAGGNRGWLISGTSPGISMTIGAVAGIDAASCANQVADAWVHLMCFLNRGEESANGFICYCNATAGSGSDPSAMAGTITSAIPVGMGARTNDGAAPLDSRIAYVAMWKQSDWHQAGAAGPTEWAAIAKERHAGLLGILPDTHHGTAVPNVMSRSTTKTTFKSGEMFVLGANWLDTVGQQYRSEGAITNKLIQSDDFTSWTELNASTNDTTDTAGNGDPYGTDVGDGVVAAAEAAEHGFSQAATLTAATWTQSVFVKAGSVDFVVLDDSTVANTTTWFQISTCAAATTGAAVLSTFAVNATTGGWATGWCRVGIAYTGTAAPHTIRYLGDDADNGGASYTGDGATINYILAGAQLELADHPTSYMPTVLAAADRGPDLLQYKMDDGNYGDGNGGIGTVEVVATRGNYDNQSSVYNLTLSDGGSASDNIVLLYRTNDGGRVTTAKTAGNAGNVNGATDITDGAEHVLRATWQTNELILYVDGVAEGATDTSIDPPVGIDEMDVGTYVSDNVPANDPINRIRLWTTVQVP